MSPGTMASPAPAMSPGSMASPGSMGTPGPAGTPASENAPVQSPKSGPPEKAGPANPLAGHLPIIDLIPETDWSNIDGAHGVTTPGAVLPGNVSGSFNFSGTFTLPIYAGISASYDRVAGGFLDATYGKIAVGGKSLEVGTHKRHMDVFRLDVPIAKTGIGFEAAILNHAYESATFNAPDSGQSAAGRDGYFWHAAYVQLAYSTPKIKALNGTSFLFAERGLTANHAPSALDIAADPTEQKQYRQYATAQIVSATVPMNPKFYVTGTLYNGAYDFYDQFPFPLRYNAVNATANFALLPQTTLIAGWWDVWNEHTGAQGSVFAFPNSVHFAQFYTALDVHLDLNKFLH